MTVMETATLTVTIDAPFERVAADLADPATHPEWGTEFFTGKAERVEDDNYELVSPVMGGKVLYRVESDIKKGLFNLFLAPAGGDYGPPIPVRLIPNGTGVDVLWTLARMPGQPEEIWK